MKKRGQGDWSFTQRKDKVWTARKQFGKKADGKPNIKAFYGSSITEVKKKARDYERLLEDNRGKEVTNTTLYEYIKNWMETYKQYSVKDTTYDCLEDALEVRIKPYDISNMQISSLSPEICQRYINDLTGSDAKYSLATITKTYNTINSCLRYAEAVGDIIRNPMALVNLPSVDKIQTPEKVSRFFTTDEIKLIRDRCYAKFKNGVPVYAYGNVIVLLMFTGMRIGECLGLRWCDIDFENNTINIDNTIAVVVDRDKRSSKKTKITNTSPKTRKSNRKIPMSSTAKEAILNIKNSRNKWLSDEDYVVVTSNGRIADARNIRRCLDSVLKSCGLQSDDKGENCGLHALRHTFASTLLAKGVDIKIISDLLGHEKVSTTYNIYAHLIPEQKETSVKLLDDI